MNILGKALSKSLKRRFHRIVLEHAVVLDSIIGWESSLGGWSRVEGILPKVNPNTPNSRVESDRLFDDKGKFMSQCAVLGRGVTGLSVFKDILIFLENFL